MTVLELQVTVLEVYELAPALDVYVKVLEIQVILLDLSMKFLVEN